MHSPLSTRSLVVFFGLEAILAGVLIMLNAWSGPALIASGAALLVGLWIWEHRPQWIPTVARSDTPVHMATLGLVAALCVGILVWFVFERAMPPAEPTPGSPPPISTGIALRTLSAPAQTELLSQIRARIPTPGRISLEIVGDARLFALMETLASIFQSAGWNVSPLSDTFFTMYLEGVIISGPNRQLIDELVRIFRQIGISDTRAEVGPVSGGDVHIRIGQATRENG